MTDMVMPDIAQPVPPKKSNKTVIIIVVVLLVLCCLCVAVGAILYFTTDLFVGLIGGTDLVGNWDVNFSWDCTGTYSQGLLIFYDDDTFNVNNDASLWGTWSISSSNVDFIFDEYPQTHYIGTVSGDHMEGTMTNLDAMTGCWYADKK